MGEENFRYRKIAVIGNTKLTLKSLQRLVHPLCICCHYDIKYVFGLPEVMFKNKVNAVSLVEFCHYNNITYNNSNDWKIFKDDCEALGVDLVIALGDSRIVPSTVINRFETIGNHGAVLPYVQGGASLVWGRMLNSGEWGVSIFRLEEKVDAGDILKTKTFTYSTDIDMLEFTRHADDLTVEALLECLCSDIKSTDNHKWRVNVAKHTDSQLVVKLLKSCLATNTAIYLPPRNYHDAYINRRWSSKFKKLFKIANNDPYPTWRPLK